jgi:hypothetical protein
MKQQFGDLELWLLSTGIHDTRRWIGFLDASSLHAQRAQSSVLPNEPAPVYLGARVHQSWCLSDALG